MLVSVIKCLIKNHTMANNLIRLKPTFKKNKQTSFGSCSFVGNQVTFTATFLLFKCHHFCSHATVNISLINSAPVSLTDCQSFRENDL